MNFSRSHVLDRIRSAGRVLWFLDYDGTLTPIVHHAEEAFLKAETRTLLEELVGRDSMKVAVVSGRPMKDVKARVGIRGICYAGNHGLEISGPGIRFRHPEVKAARSSLQKASWAWMELADRYPGAWVEDKGMTVSVHYRQVEGLRQEEFSRVAVTTVGPLTGKGLVRLTFGKKVVEARPPTLWGKGDAIGYLLGRWNYEPKTDLPVAAGDDQTDRDSFAALREGGIAIHIGRSAPPPEANARLPGPTALHRFLAEAARI